MPPLTPSDRRLIAAVLDTMAHHVACDEMLVAIAAPLVGAFADACLVDRRDDRGHVERLVAIHADPSLRDLLKEVQSRYPPTAQHPIMDVMRTGRPVFERVITDKTLRRMARDEVHLEILRKSGATSTMRLPIFVRERTVAVLSLSLTRHRRTAMPRRFAVHDFVVGRELARSVSAQLSGPWDSRTVRQLT